MQNITVLAKVKQDENFSQDTSEFSSVGVMLVSQDLRVMYYDSKAKEICLSARQVEPPKDVNFPLPHEIVDECSVLKGSLERGSKSAHLIRQRYILSGENKKLRIETSTVRQPVGTVPTNCFLVYLEDLSEAGKDREEILRDRYYLAEREIQIAWCVSEGLSNKEIADKLFISRFTVENHLRSIFYKMGVENRIQLTRLMKLP